MAHCIPTYMMASGIDLRRYELVAGSDPICWEYHRPRAHLAELASSTKYGIPFPFSHGSLRDGRIQFPALMRAIVACGWFGIQAWIGGQAINIFFGALFPLEHLARRSDRRAHSDGMAIIPDLLGNEHFHNLSRDGFASHFENWAAPFVLIMTAMLLAG